MKMYTTPEAAAYLGMKLTTLRKYIYVKGKLRPDMRVGHYPLFSQKNLDDFQRQHVLSMDGRSAAARDLRVKPVKTDS